MMKNHNPRTKLTSTALFLALSTLALSGCDGTKKQLGLEKSTPDEFAVVKRAPLELPPDYSLRPPRPGAPRPQEQATAKEAETVIFGRQQGQKMMKPNNAEDALLQKAGANQAVDDIRNIVDYETSLLTPKEKPVAEKIFGLGGNKGEQPASVLDAEAEAERLRKNVEEGRPINEGDTPVKEE